MSGVLYPRAIPVLIEWLDRVDDQVPPGERRTSHAVMALGRLKPLGVRPAVERLLDYPRSLVRREAKKALARLPA